MPDADRRSPVDLGVLIAGALLLPVILLVHGLLPGLINDGPWNYLLEGDMRCLELMGTEALRSWCDWYGLPNGYPFLSSGPIAWLGWALMYPTGMGSYPAYLIAGAFFDALALAGGYGLMRMLGTGRVVALGTAAAYLVTPTVVGMKGYGGTFTGFALLPAYAFADLLAMRAVAQGGRRRVALALVGYSFVRTSALFLDGYSFVASSLLAVLLWAAYLLREPLGGRRRLLGAAALVGAHVVAYTLYTLYAPAYDQDAPLELFRSMGLDIVTLVQPADIVWSADLLGVGADHSDLWGDGSNAVYNYVGFITLALALAGLVWRLRDRHVAPLAVAGLLAAVLALGPSLKVGETRPAITGIPTYESYLMPEDTATADLPWDGVYTALPGLEDMRAIYRWNGLTRLVLLVLAGLAVDRLARVHRRRLLAGAAAVLAVAEVVPNVPRLYDSYRANERNRAALDRDVVRDLQAATERGERVFFLQPDPDYNDYLVNYLATSMEVRAFNAGGDKNAGLAQRSWPQSVLALTDPARTPQVLQVAFDTSLNVVVAPYFDLRAATYAWPPSEADRAAAEQAYAAVFDDERFDVDRYRWFATIRPR